MNKKRTISPKRKTLIRKCIQEMLDAIKLDKRSFKQIYDYLTHPSRCPDLFITMTLKDAPLYAFQKLSPDTYHTITVLMARRIIKERSYKNASKNLLFKTN